jgi:flagellar protein FlaG
MAIQIQSRAAQPPVLSAAVQPTPTVQAVITPAPVAKSEVTVDNERMRQNLDAAIEHINTVMRDGGRNLSFAVDPALGRPVVVVRKEDTGEVIRQIPNEVVVKVAHSIEALKGVLLNKEI